MPEVTGAFTLLLLTGDRHEQVVACLTSLLFQVPAGTYLELWDNGRHPLIESPMFRGLIELAGLARGWVMTYRAQTRGTVGEMKAEVVAKLPERAGSLLWTDDDCVWAPHAVVALERAALNYRVVAPVVVDVLDRGFPDFTSLERLHSHSDQANPQHHLYAHGLDPFEAESLAGVFMCRYVDLKTVGFSSFPMIHDAITTMQLPGPKAIVPAAEVYHFPHTRGPSPWGGLSLPAMYRQGLIEVTDVSLSCRRDEQTKDIEGGRGQERPCFLH